MSGLLENPLPVLALGAFTAIVLGAIWLQTGTKQFLYGLIAVLVVMVAAVILERVIETEREKVSATLHQIAREVERNDAQAATRHVHSSAPRLRQRATAEMQRWTFEQVSIKPNLKIDVYSHEDPPRAVAQFNVMVIVSDRVGLAESIRAPRFFTVTLLKEDGEWRVSAYAHYDPQAGYQRQ